MTTAMASQMCHAPLAVGLAGVLRWSARAAGALRSRCRVPNGIPAAPPTAWVDARTLEPRWPPASALKPPSRFCCAARNALAGR